MRFSRDLAFERFDLLKRIQSNQRLPGLAAAPDDFAARFA
jgi:hypothetical protein